jgi:hypothetical protein
MKLVKLKKQGYKALVESLGVAGMIRFLQQFDVGEGDYTRDRHHVTDHLTMADFQAYLNQQKEKNDPS